PLAPRLMRSRNAMETKTTMPMHNRSECFLALVAIGAVLWMEACSVGPNYKRPAVNAPASFRGVSPTEEPASAPVPASSIPAAPGTPSTTSLGDEKWWEVFQDKELQELIRTALKKNYDIRIAAARVLQAQAQLGITRADQLPSLSVGGNVIGTRNPQ